MCPFKSATVVSGDGSKSLITKLKITLNSKDLISLQVRSIKKLNFNKMMIKAYARKLQAS